MWKPFRSYHFEDRDRDGRVIKKELAETGFIAVGFMELAQKYLVLRVSVCQSVRHNRSYGGRSYNSPEERKRCGQL
jgi:hypothetical protein